MPADSELIVEHIPTGVLGAAESGVRFLRNRDTADLVVEAVSFMPNIAVTANDTNYRSMSCLGGTQALFTAVPTTVAGGSLVAGTAVDFTLLQTAAAVTARRLVAGTGFLKLDLAVTASGVAIDGVWEIKLRRARPM